LEKSPEEHVANLVTVFREVARVLRGDGTLWLNLGDCYASSVNGRKAGDIVEDDRTFRDKPFNTAVGGLKPKDLVGQPWRVAFALQADGWYLRSDIIWSKPNPMPESVTDRPTKSHEYLFLLSKQPKYYYDAEAIKEPNSSPEQLEHNLRYAKPYAAYDERAVHTGQPGNVNNVGIHARPGGAGRSRRDVWTIPTQPYKGAHFATYPEKLVEPCILAGSKPGDVVLDPFCGSGTTGAVARRFGRRFFGLDLSMPYLALAQERIAAVPAGMPL
jgi:site-specific DNA-methyltransferase (cytosine-N4-specific)